MYIHGQRLSTEFCLRGDHVRRLHSAHLLCLYVIVVTLSRVFVAFNAGAVRGRQEWLGRSRLFFVCFSVSVLLSAAPLGVSFILMESFLAIVPVWPFDTCRSVRWFLKPVQHYQKGIRILKQR